MMISLIPSTGERTKMGCYAKFQIYTKDIKPYVDAYVKAFNELLNGDTFHIRVRKYYGEDTTAADQYTITEVWKAGQDYFQHWATYYLDDTFRWDGGDLLRNGMGYDLTFGTGTPDTQPETVKNVQYLEPFNFTLHVSSFDYFSRGVDAVTTDGDTVIFIKDKEYRNDVFFGSRQVMVEYAPSGTVVMKDGSEILLTGMGGSPSCDEPMSQLKAESTIELAKVEYILLPDGTKPTVPNNAT